MLQGGGTARNHVSFLSPPVESFAELPSSITSTSSPLPYSGPQVIQRYSRSRQCFLSDINSMVLLGISVFQQRFEYCLRHCSDRDNLLSNFVKPDVQTCYWYLLRTLQHQFVHNNFRHLFSFALIMNSCMQHWYCNLSKISICIIVQFLEI